jgi:hypothetical protein
VPAADRPTLGGIDRHILGLAIGRGDLVRAKFIAIGAGQIALVCDVEHQCLKRIIALRLGRGGGRDGLIRNDHAGKAKLAHQILGIHRAVTRPGQSGDQISMGHFACVQHGQHFAHRTVERKDGARRNEVDEILTLGVKAVDFAAAIGVVQRNAH